VLSVVSEWWKLGVARAEAEAEVKGLERARVVQEELTDLITHEVRNPLTIILGHCQLARASRVAHSSHAGHVEEHLDHIYQAGKTIERLMGNLLQITRVETSDEPEGSEAVDLGMLARDVTAELEPLAEQKGQTIVLDVPEQAPLAQGSPLLLREALTNLVSNAVKYTPEGGQVNVWARSGPAPGTATLGVTDTGIGLSEEDQERLFTKFFRSADPRVTRERGTGLGLALTHAIVERMGGRIAVESRLNEGATFRVLLPSASGRD
jgi:signal transduction histidine kinase